MSINLQILQTTTREIESCTENLFVLATTSSTLSWPDMKILQWWIDGVNDGNAKALDLLRHLEQSGMGYKLPKWKVIPQIKMKHIYPNGPKTQLFQQELDKLKRYFHASDSLAADPNFDPCSEETSLHLDGMLALFQVKGDDQVDETLRIENPGLWETLELPPIDCANDNLPGPPADNATAINHILGLDAY